MREMTSVGGRRVLFVTTVAAFMSSFAVSSVNVSLPPLGLELGLSGVSLNWITTAFVLGAAVFMLPMGRMGDIAGRKRVLAGGMAVYAIGALLAFFARSGAFLVATRAFTGLGAAMLAGTSTAILVDSHPPGERGRVLGINVASVYIGLSIGPFVGGLVTDAWGWRSLFLVHGALALAEFALILFLLRGEWYAAEGERMDWAGAAIYAVGLAALLLGLSRLPSGPGFALLALGAAALAAFVAWELRCGQPLLQVRMFLGNRVFALSNAAAMISYSATYATAFFMSLYLEVARGLPPRTAGLVLVAQPVVQAAFSPFMGRLSDRVEPRVLASTGMALTALGLVVLALLTPTVPLAVPIGALVLLGLGYAFFSSPNTNAVMGSVDRAQVGIASATVSTMRVIGQAFSMGIALVLFSVFLGSAPVEPGTVVPFMRALRASFGIAAGLCFLGIFASLARGTMERGRH
jgi:MFS family permease